MCEKTIFTSGLQQSDDYEGYLRFLAERETTKSTENQLKMTASQQRSTVVKAVESREGKNNYTNDDRRDDVDGGWSDCSSLMHWAYTKINKEIGGYTGDQIENGSWVVQGGQYPNESKLLPGDLLFFKDKNYNGRPYNDGHVEMYIGSGTIMGHGSGVGPTRKDMNAYCDWREGYGGPYIGVKRYISGGSSSGGDGDLQYGSTGAAVEEMQRMLIALGYNCGGYGADGDYGQGTVDSVKKFQKDHGLSVTGIYNAATKKALVAAYKALSGGGSGETGLKEGDTGVHVVALQGLLISMGFSCGDSGADGDYGQGTVSAVKALQKKYGLKTSGVYNKATKNTLSIAYSAKISIDDSLLMEGDDGTPVKLLQAMLIISGYSCGASGADGDYGQGTVNAVSKFQNAKGLEADGVYGHDTRIKLFATYKGK